MWMADEEDMAQLVHFLASDASLAEVRRRVMTYDACSGVSKPGDVSLL